MLKIHICVAHAQVKNQEKPGTYGKELNKILKVNNLPDIIKPDESEDTADEPEVGAIGQTTNLKPETKIKKPSISRQSSTGNLSNKDDDETVKTLEACDPGLQFFTVKSRGWPRNFSTDELIRDIQNNKVKWRYTDNKYAEEQLLRKTKKGEIIFK